MDVVTVDKKGRITIPKPQREALGIEAEDEFTLEVAGGELRLRPVPRNPLKVRGGRRRGREASLTSRRRRLPTSTFIDVNVLAIECENPVPADVLVGFGAAPAG